MISYRTMDKELEKEYESLVQKVFSKGCTDGFTHFFLNTDLVVKRTMSLLVLTMVFGLW